LIILFWNFFTHLKFDDFLSGQENRMTFCQSGFFFAGNFESRFKTNFLTAQETGLMISG